MTAQQKRLMKLPREVKKAIFSGSGYLEYKTLLQFHRKAEKLLESRIDAMNAYLDRFEERGGRLEQTENGCIVSSGGVSYEIEFDRRGVARYTVENPTGHEDDLEYLHGLFFCLYTLPLYESTLERIREGMADMENSVVLQGICDLRKIITDDRYLTVAAVSGLEVRVENELDPFEVFGDD